MSRRATVTTILAAAARRATRRAPTRSARPRSGTAPPSASASESADRDPAPAAGTFSKRSSETFATVSGRTSATRRGRGASLLERGAEGRRQRGASCTLAAFSAGVDRARRQRLGRVRADDHTRPALPRQRHGAVTRSRGDLDARPTAAGSRASVAVQRSFDERHLVDLAQRRDALRAPARPPTRAGSASPRRAPPS